MLADICRHPWPTDICQPPPTSCQHRPMSFLPLLMSQKRHMSPTPDINRIPPAANEPFECCRGIVSRVFAVPRVCAHALSLPDSLAHDVETQECERNTGFQHYDDPFASIAKTCLMHSCSRLCAVQCTIGFRGSATISSNCSSASASSFTSPTTALRTQRVVR